jgi:exopolyphosphatase/guanosine-5'-triphosphate,3'-diphosphate pyrophosphatase
VDQAVAILRDYLQTMREYGIPSSQLRLFTSNILAEAANHEIFLNRLQVHSGVIPSLIDDGNMTRLVYQIAQRLLLKNPTLAKGNTFVTHIGPGNTRAIYFQQGRLAAYSNYRLGIFRAREASPRQTMRLRSRCCISKSTSAASSITSRRITPV